MHDKTIIQRYQDCFSAEAILNIATDFSIWLCDRNNVWYKDFFLDKGIDPDWLDKWAKIYPQWKVLKKVALDMQESVLVHGGLDGSKKEGMVKLVLANKHGWKTDKSSQEISVEGGDALTNLLKQIEDKGNTIDVTPE